MGSTGQEMWSLFQVFEVGNGSFLARSIPGLTQNEQHSFAGRFQSDWKNKTGGIGRSGPHSETTERGPSWWSKQLGENQTLGA
jgi:hypothetical protein